MLKRWKLLDNSITDANNEAKDNVKYLSTLEKYIEPLRLGNPESILDSLPGLLNNIKMMHTIARYYNTSERWGGGGQGQGRGRGGWTRRGGDRSRKGVSLTPTHGCTTTTTIYSSSSSRPNPNTQFVINNNHQPTSH